MSDCLIFAVLFAAFGVLGGNYAAGPSPKDHDDRAARPADPSLRHRRDR